MGLLDGLMGNESEMDPAKVAAEFAPLLAPGEQVQKVYRLLRDLFVLTDKRLVLVDKQGVTGSKVEYHSIPYRSVTHFSVETAGTFDLEAELRIWISGTPDPIHKQFGRGTDVGEVQRTLASYILR